MASTIKFFTINPFQENTYIIYDETLECIIIDPGCSNPDEEQAKNIWDEIKSNKLIPIEVNFIHKYFL